MALRLLLPGLFIGLVGSISFIYSYSHDRHLALAISCPFGNTYTDGCSGASTGVGQYPSMLNGYTARPPWNVAAVDYPVGIPSGTVLTPWRSASITNVLFDLASGQVNCTGPPGTTVTLDSIDFSPAAGVSPYIYGYSSSCNWVIKNSKFTCPGTFGNVIADDLTLTNNEFDQAGCGDLSTFVQGSNVTLKYNWFKHGIQHVLESGGPGTIDMEFNLFDDMLAQGTSPICSGQACHENWQQLTGTATISADTIKFNTNYQHTDGSGNGEGFQFYCNSGPCQVTNPVLSNNTMICMAGTGMSNVINGGDPSHPGNIVNGMNTDNYFDPSGCTPYYENTITTTNHWTSSGNIDMTNGKNINPADSSESGGPAANLWVDINGGTCTRQATAGAYNDATACGSLDTAYAAAQAGDTVFIKGGSYGSQTIADRTALGTTPVVFHPAPSESVTLADLTVNTHDITIDGGDGLNSNEADRITVSTSLNVLETAGQGDNRNVIIEDVHMRNSFDTAHGLTIRYSEVGPLDECLGTQTGDVDLIDFWPNAGPPTNMSLLYNIIHDNNSNDCLDNGDHTDAFQNFPNGGTSNNIKIIGNRFWACAEQCIFMGDGTYTNTIVENNMVEETDTCGNCGTAGEVNVYSDNQVGAGDVFRYNTIEGSINLSSNFTMIGNIALTPQACGTANWAYTIFPVSGGSTCGTNFKRCVPTLASGGTYSGDNSADWHLSSSDTCAAGAGDSASYPMVDIDADMRSSPPWAGADEYIAGGGADITAPTKPTNLAKTSSTTSSISLAWTASTDNVAVSGYKLYKNGTNVGSLAGTSTTFSSLACGTSYSLAVQAYDAAGNNSSQASISAATSACPSSGGTTPPPPTYKQGDCNHDNAVNIFDLSILLSHYNSNYSSADFDTNAIVNVIDLSILLSNYGK